MSIRSWLQGRSSAKDAERNGRRAEAGRRARRTILRQKADPAAVSHEQLSHTRQLGGMGGGGF